MGRVQGPTTKIVEYVPIRAAPARRRAKQRVRNGNTGGMWNTIANGASKLLGKGIGALISGFGDYKIAGNTLMTGGLDPPTVVNSVNNGGVIVRHREYLMDINATTAFTIQTLPLNTGLLETFPWLSAIATHFEQYKFQGLLFEFKSLSSDAVLSSATSSALGSVVMATQYNALNPPFPDKFTMENYEFANSAKPSLSFIHPVECARKDTPLTELYVRGGAPAPGSDLRLYDLGNFHIATVGMQAASGVCGELWCTYEVELMKPKIETVQNTNLVDHFRLTASGTNSSPFTGNDTAGFNTLGGELGDNVYTFPVAMNTGLFIIIWYIFGPSTALTSPTVTLDDCVANALFANNSTSVISNGGNTDASFFMLRSVRITDTGATVSFGTDGVYPLPTTAGDFFVIEIPSDLTYDMPITIRNNPIYSEMDDLISMFRKLTPEVRSKAINQLFGL